MGVAIRTADPALYAEIHTSYKEAMAKGLWKNHYASTNANEYWAEGAQTWFWSNYEYMDGETRVQTPEDLQRYDPKLYELLSRVYAEKDRYNKNAFRSVTTVGLRLEIVMQPNWSAGLHEWKVK